MIEVVEYRYGRLLSLDTDIYQGRFLREYGQYSPAEAELFAQIVNKGDVVIEVGANIGVHTIALARMVGSSGAVFALEPQTQLYYMLCGNVALNGCAQQVNALNMAASCEQGTLIVPRMDYEQPGNFGGVSLQPNGAAMVSGRSVGAITLDAVAGSFSRLQLLKIDAEGMEFEILYGAQELIAHTKPFLYVEDDREQNSARLRETIRQYGYRLYHHLPFYIEALDRQSLPEDIRFLVSSNILAIPTEVNCQIDLEEI